MVKVVRTGFSQMMDFKKKSLQTIEWIINSGIRYQYPENNINAFYESYNTHNKRYSFLYCEVTGYAINFLLNFHQREKNNKYLELAQRAGDFLVRYQCKQGKATGAIPWTVEKGREHHHYYSFDTAMCLIGLINLYSTTKEQKYFVSAVLAADWLINFAQNKNGSFKALFDSHQNVFDNKLLENAWSGDGGCLHIKHIIGLLKTFKMTGQSKYLTSAKKTLTWAKKMQNEDGAFKIREDSDIIFTHAHCYATEGIIYAYIHFDDNDYKKIILDSADWLLKAQNQDGSFFDYYGLPGILTRFIKTKKIIKKIHNGFFTIDSNAFLKIKRTDATAQAARIMLFAYVLTHNIEYQDAAAKSLDFLDKMQIQDHSSSQNGAVCFGLLDLPGIKKRSHKYPSWSGMFMADAMYYMFILQQKINIKPCNIRDQIF